MPGRRGAARAAGLVVGFVLDRRLGDPARFHPVAGFGRLAGALEKLTYADRRANGVIHVAVLVGGSALLGLAADRAARRLGPLGESAAVAAVTWTVLGGRSLEREALAVAALLEAGDLPAARQRVTHLVGRDPDRLDESAVVRATVESVAENTSDAVVAPLLAGGLAGVPGLLAYRAANTLDAMVGHRTPRLRSFGWAAARFDDVLNLVPARVAAASAAACAPLVGGSPVRSVRTWRRDAAAHPSPNAGPVEAAFAGALDVRLGGVNVYEGRTEDRHTLGDGPTPALADVERSTRLAHAVDLTALGVAAAVATGCGRRRRTHASRPTTR
ncbi:cobalamin biosynthesis protein [Aeromicrobium halocynthiae]|uniref:Cobalamin biosynthesis protein CobD n=1 Tax=Aeromicrobium halocynthiae TaxID=560557 RepID=A0ABN2VV88_9ACTN